ncbi:MAG TPA: class I SAM-dependent methyltransferase [Tepidisphaeraceae bacterium]|nr:class I SAM-dependent methyltransferase [Tepidisphaeraceae bacterium]
MDDDVVNHFVHASSAARYAAARPYFDPMVVERIVRWTGCERFARALDVACGTGQSAKALATVCESVDAIDVVAEMLAQAVALGSHSCSDSVALDFMSNR